MKVRPTPHRWSLTPRQAIAVQRRLAAKVLVTEPAKPMRLVAGLDCAFTSTECLAAVVLWDAETHAVIEQHTASRPLRFPYVPGLLSFREIPALLAALRKLKQTPDALICDGQGLAHPRRFGIASHLGVLCDLPTVGCAKSRLLGEHAVPARSRGSTALLFDKGEIIGEVLRTQDDGRPVYVSIGHRLTLPAAREIVLRCVTQHRLPEPTYLADHLVSKFKQSLRASTSKRK
jgi:deoxyribonuclease V